MAMVHSLEPVVDAQSVVLVLGTMPGKESLKAHRYYMDPRNQFWRLVGAIFDIDLLSSAYPSRVAALTARRVGLWDVLQCCTRESSLDSDIEDPVPNDFVTFFKTYPNVTRVFFNGEPAETKYRSLVEKTLPTSVQLKYQRLPSTSGAYAAMKYEEKLKLWSVIKTEA